MSKRHFALIAVLVVIVGGPAIVHARDTTSRPLAIASEGLSEDVVLTQLKKKHDCIRVVMAARTKALTDGWKAHQDARRKADDVHRNVLTAADDAYRLCADAQSLCKSVRQAARKSAHTDIKNAYAAARQAWKEGRKRAVLNYQSAKARCVAL